MPSNPYASKLASLILGELYIYLKTNDIGHLTTEVGAYMVDGERYAPDVAFIRYERQSELARQGYNPNPPDLAVEVISDPKSAAEQENLRIKISHCMIAQTTVWVFNFSSQTVEIHEPGKAVMVVNRTETLRAETILPGFALKLTDIFREDKPKQ